MGGKTTKTDAAGDVTGDKPETIEGAGAGVSETATGLAQGRGEPLEDSVTLEELAEQLLALPKFTAALEDAACRMVWGIVAGLDHDALKPALLEAPGFVNAVNDLVGEQRTLITAAVLAESPFVEGVETIVAGYLAKHAPASEEAVDPRAQIAAAQEAIDDAKIAANKAEERKRAKAVEKAHEARQAKLAKARDGYASAMADEPKPIDLPSVKAAMLSVYDGQSFSIDFNLPVDLGDLVASGSDGVSLRHGPIDIGEGIDDQFMMQGTALHLLMDDDAVVLWCPLTAPMPVGGGRRAQLSANSLIFRPRR